MPTLTIDGRAVTVEAGSNVLQAALQLGIVVPHFCYHQALGAVGACRLCAMTFLEGPVKGLKMACLVQAQDGMVVSSSEPDAREMRRAVIEWLMINHPHDCPVCDEGGECQLQDMTVGGGHSLRRYRGNKRTYPKQDLGPFVEQEMNRCIQCYRCVRTYRDYCGGDDFGVLGSAQRVFFGRLGDGRLTSPFSGNLVDVCPTGVFTDKTCRFKARHWDLEQAPSICPHCSLGCATVPAARYRELLRVTGRPSHQTNGHFLCDRGRFGYGYVNHPERPRTPRMDGKEVSFQGAVTGLRARLAVIASRCGPASLAFLGGNRASLEAAFLLRAWARGVGTERVVLEAHPGRDRSARLVVQGLGALARSQQDIRQADLLVMTGLDPIAEAPMLAVAVRQAVRRGAKAWIMDPRAIQAPFPARRMSMAPWLLPSALLGLAAGGPPDLLKEEKAAFQDLRRDLKEAQRPILLGGIDVLGASGVAALLQAAEALSKPARTCGAVLALAGPNSFGNALLAGPGPDFDGILSDIESGAVRALVCLEADPLTEHPDPRRVEAALARLELLAVLDCLPTRTVERAQAFLPTAATAEMDGTFVNQEGRLLAYRRVFTAGLPIRVTGQGDHPPRTFLPETPGNQPRPDWAALCALLQRDADLPTLRTEIEKTDPRFAGLTSLTAEDEGCRAILDQPGPLPEASPPAAPEPGLSLLVTESLFGSELLSSFSAPVAGVVPAAVLCLNSIQARELGLAEGEQAVLSGGFGELRLPVRLEPDQARGLAVVARLRGTITDGLVPGGGFAAVQVRKGGGP